MKSLLAVGCSSGTVGLLRGPLAAAGWELRTAEGWMQVFLRLRERTYGAVISEETLPDGDWRDVLDELRLCTSPPPLIVASRPEVLMTRATVLDAGGFDVVHSPLDAGTVLPALESAVARFYGHEDTPVVQRVRVGSIHPEDF